ncbi:MAG: OmpA family protein [Acidimicrobiales bacterium]
MESTPRIIVPPETAAAGPTPPPVPPLDPNRGGNGRTLTLVLLGSIALLSVGSIGYALGQRGTSGEGDTIELGVLEEPTTTPNQTSASVVDAVASSTTTTPTTAPTTVATTTAPASSPTTTAAPRNDESAVLEGPPLRDTGTVRQAVLADGILYLRGKVPSQPFGNEIARLAGQVVGPDNVVNQYEVDPSAPPVDSAPLYVADTVLFPTGGVQINPAFLPLLDLGTTLLSVNENVTITVVAHTDSAGSTGLNQRLSQARAEVVRQYWIDQGADGDRIIADGRGEAEPIADNSTPEGKQLNRRAEFIVTGILG